MIITFIAIAGLLLSNKDDVVRFINKHNINWFERNLVHTQINNNKQQTKDTHNQNQNNVNSGSSDALNTAKASSQKLIALGYDGAHERNAIDLMNKKMMASSNKASLTATAGTGTNRATVITNPPISSEKITTQYAPAWKNLIINKIVNSNNKELDAMNSEGNVETRSTSMNAQIKATTRVTPTLATLTITTTTITTLAPVQHESTLEWVHNDISGKSERHRGRMQGIDESNKIAAAPTAATPNGKAPYWYIDPSIVYRAMTSPINPSDHSASFILASLLFVICLFFFLYCVMTDKFCCGCCCTRKRVKIKTENEIHEVNTTLLANHDYNNSSDDD
ncbi:uncharacterized protein LOC116336714 [Contarinia nasturtii]|uniref:uncharacterized protein LOC116336714 n=1 Tax=Contarinia nasturtii TaxID=265458 RepID=UPI0012D4B764|nr:uncharacterized protein LOC116336714 [Contarinia nasturtii]